jgi:hypothetical protein
MRCNCNKPCFVPGPSFLFTAIACYGITYCSHKNIISHFSDAACFCFVPRHSDVDVLYSAQRVLLRARGDGHWRCVVNKKNGALWLKRFLCSRYTELAIEKLFWTPGSDLFLSSASQGPYSAPTPMGRSAIWCGSACQ